MLAIMLPAPALGKGSGVGSGMGGLYWLYFVLALLIVGIVGYVAFQYWKQQRLKEKMAKDTVHAKVDAVSRYEQDKLQAFNAHFQRDLELAAKKKECKLDPRVDRVIELARAGQRKEAFADIDRGAVEVNCTDSFGRSLLMIAAEMGDSRLCDGLLRRGADINQRNKFNGATVLHFAYQYEHDSLGLSLVARGADDSIRAIDGRTCYQLRDDDYDVEASDAEMMKVQAPAPRREMNAGVKAAGRKKDGPGGKVSKGHTRRNSAGYDKMGDPTGYPGVPQKYAA